MDLFSLEHSKSAYLADFALYGAAVLLLAAFLLLAGPRERQLEIAAFAWVGLVSWTVIEYALHRFVLHRLPPFSRWHAEHHQRPMALICAPTVLSAGLIAALVFLPALVLGNLWSACALTLGVLGGRLADSAPGGFVQRGMRCIASDGGHDGDLQKKDVLDKTALVPTKHPNNCQISSVYSFRC